MDTQKLRAVILAAELGSLSMAAEELSYTPSAMTHIADAVEAELGVKIIRRSHRGIGLTDDGKALMPKLKRMLELEDDILKCAQELSRDSSNELKIGSYASIALYVLPELLGRFKKLYPEIKISVTVVSSFSDDPQKNEFDIAFGDLKQNPKIEHYEYMKDNFVAVVSESLFSGRESVKREELYAYPLIMTNDTVMTTYFDAELFPDVIRFTSADDMSVISMVREGIGIAVLPSLSIPKNEVGIKKLSLEPDVFRQLTFAPSPLSRSSRALALFVGFLKENMNVRKVECD